MAGLTKIQLIDLAIFQSQLDSSYQAQGRIWLNMMFQNLYKDFKWPFYNKLGSYVPFVSGQTEYDVPADYWRSDSIYIFNVQGQQGQNLPVLEPYLFDQYRYATVEGRPQCAMIDIQRGKIVINTLPGPQDTQHGIKLRYWRVPTIPGLTSADDATVPDFEDQNYLVQQLMKWALEARDDDRQQDKRQEAKECLVQTKRNAYDNDGTSTVPLELTHFRSRSRSGYRRLR